MNIIHNHLRQRLLNQELLVGTFQKTPSMMVSEVLAKTDLQLICIDAEHSPFDRMHIDQCVFAFRAENMPTLVRVPASRPEHISNALDCGATGVLVPHVNSADVARDIVRLSRYGADGRGYAGSTRSAHYGGRTITQNFSENTSDNVIIAQIEDVSALICIEEIVAVEGLDAIFIGMADLAVALGCLSLSEPKVTQAALTICEAAKKNNVCIGIFVADFEQIPFWKKQGVSLFLLASEHAFIKQSANKMIANVNKNSK